MKDFLPSSVACAEKGKLRASPVTSVVTAMASHKGILARALRSLLDIHIVNLVLLARDHSSSD